MPDDLEKRLRNVEDDHREQKLLYQHMAKTLDTISADIRTALDLKGKVDDHNGQLKKLWLKVDKFQELRGEFDILKSEHATCSPKVFVLDDHAMGCDFRLSALEKKADAAGAFVAGRAASLADKVITWIVGGGSAGALFAAVARYLEK